MQKKLLTIVFCGLVLTLTACAQQNTTNPITPPVIENPDDGRADQATICMGLCEYKIQDLCKDDIVDSQANGTFNEEGPLDIASCQLMCEADWGENTLGCVSDAVECAQIMDSSPYCLGIDEDDSDKEIPETDLGCPKACEKYKKCAGYADDATQEDMDEAYTSCMEFCATWDASVPKCINKYPINNPMDCAPMTACALKAF